MQRTAFVSAFFWAAAACTGGAAPRADPPAGCEQTAMTTPAMRACAAARASAADVRLNRSYQEVLKYLGKSGEERAKLVAAQRAWLAFRDADCAFFGAGDGSLAPVNQAYCSAELSEERAKELDGWPPNAPRDALAPPPS